jgi:stage V sporulation protein G
MAKTTNATTNQKQDQATNQNPAQTSQAAAPAQEMPPVHLDVRVRPIPPQGNLMGYANVTINGCFAVRNIKVVSGENGLFASMPSYQDGNGQYRDVCFPVTTEFRQQLHQAVVAGYQQALEQMQAATQQALQQTQAAREAPAPADPAMAM